MREANRKPATRPGTVATAAAHSRVLRGGSALAALLACALLLLPGPVAAQEGRGPRVQDPGWRPVPDTPPAGPLLVRGSQAGPAQPRIKGALPPQVKCRLEQAFSVAVSTVRSNERCQGLFASLGLKGVDAFQLMLFFEGQDRGPCAKGAPAFNYYGHPLTGLCASFGRLEAGEAAVQLIHEALHVAGMNEFPNDPGGKTPSEISRLVRYSCFR